MKYLKKFLEENNIENIKPFDSIYNNNSIDKVEIKNDLIYDPKWESELPETISIDYHGKNIKFEKGNIMLLGDMVEISYDLSGGEKWGEPDTLEFDIYFLKNLNDDKIKIDVDITYGDLMGCEFYIEAPNKVKVIQHTTYHSKFDPSNTVFALQDESLNKFINFLNKFPGIKINRYDLRFLDKKDNYKE